MLSHLASPLYLVSNPTAWYVSFSEPHSCLQNKDKLYHPGIVETHILSAWTLSYLTSLNDYLYFTGTDRGVQRGEAMVLGHPGMWVP